jgi:DNA repair protein RadC
VITLHSFDRTPQLAELEVSYRRRRKNAEDRPAAILNSWTCEAYLRQIWNSNTMDLREEFVVLCLDSAHQVLGWVNISSGGLDATTVDPRLVFGIALQTASAAIVVAHNHPSGSLEPSPQDIAMTKRLCAAGELLSIRVLDHFILTRDGYRSFADSGHMP